MIQLSKKKLLPLL